MNMTKSQYFEELTDGLFKRGYRWLGYSGRDLQRMKKSVVVDLANLFRYGSFRDFVSSANKLGLGVYKM